MLTPQHKLSPEYHSVSRLLNGGWSGTYVILPYALGAVESRDESLVGW